MHAGTYKPCDNVMDARKQRAQLPLRKLVTRIYGAAGAAGRSSPVWKHAVKNRQRSASHPSDECFDLRRSATFFFFPDVAALCDPPSSDELHQADISRLLLLLLPRGDIKAKLQIQTD